MPQNSPTPARAHRYRTDIDGLRAVAVLLVLAAHLGTRLTGGYIGVDVFFIISGYLISSMLLAEMEAGTFSIANFYERRMRRIVPALAFMLLGTTVLAWHYLFAPEMIPYARTLIAAVLSLSNMLFWHQAGYFDWDSGFKPLLHTWSLAVEEQFYIVYPLLLLAIRRLWPRRLAAAIWLLTGITFLLAVIATHRAPVAAFFFAPLRAWELLLGTILSQHYVPVPRSSTARNVASFTGLAAILLPAALYTDTTRFPGLAALPPCLGACLILAAGETGSSFIGRLLSLRPVAFVGLISYSLYLWHWPLLVFQRLGQMFSPEPFTNVRPRLLIFLASMVMGTLSWRFVESPFRKGRHAPGRRSLFLTSAAAGMLLCSIGMLLLVTRGLPSRFAPPVSAIAGYLKYDEETPYRVGSCFILSSSPDLAHFDRKLCLHEEPGERHYLLLGDSHAAQLYPGLKQVFPELHLMQANTDACPPTLTQAPTASRVCRELMRFAFEQFLPQHHVDTLLLSTRWTLVPMDSIAATVAWAHARGIEVILIGPTPEYDLPVPHLAATALERGLKGAGAGRALQAHLLAEQPRLDARLGPVARGAWGVRYISYFENLCSAGEGCPVFATPAAPMLWDQGHMTAEGSVVFAESMRRRHQLP